MTSLKKKDTFLNEYSGFKKTRKNTLGFVELGGIFLSDNRVTYDRKRGTFGKGVKFNFSPAALWG